MEKLALDDRKDKDEVMNIERFEKRFLTKPSSLEAKLAVNNLKSVLGGKYCISSAEASATTLPSAEAGSNSSLSSSQSGETSSNDKSRMTKNSSIERETDLKDREITEKGVVSSKLDVPTAASKIETKKKRSLHSEVDCCQFVRKSPFALVRLPPLPSGTPISKPADVPKPPIDFNSVLNNLLSIE